MFLCANESTLNPNCANSLICARTFSFSCSANFSSLFPCEICEQRGRTTSLAPLQNTILVCVPLNTFDILFTFESNGNSATSL